MSSLKRIVSKKAFLFLVVCSASATEDLEVELRRESW
jgi:hypothetical protein